MMNSLRASVVVVALAVGIFPGHARAEFGDVVWTLVPRAFDRDPYAGMEFGGDVAIGGDYVLVAAEEDVWFGNEAGSVWQFDLATGEAVRTLDPPELGPGWGLGESVSIDGNLAVITSDAVNNDTGAAFIYDLTSGELLRTLTASDGQSGDEFGQKVGISGDLILVGAEGADAGVGAGYLYNTSTGEEIFRLTTGDPNEDEIGNEGAIGGNHILLGGDNDAVYLFDAMTGVLRKKLTIEGGGGFGSSTSISGNWAVVGADKVENDLGEAHLIDLQTGEFTRVFRATDGMEGDEFGDTVAIDGSIVLVSASEVNDDAGVVYVFDAVTGMQVARLESPNAVADEGFGTSIAIHEGIAVIGADGGIVDDLNSGVAYVVNVSFEALADVNDDGIVDVADIDELSAAIVSSSDDAGFDLNHDGAINELDRRLWIEALNHTFVGDSNLDGQFGSGDLVAVFGAGEYEDGIPQNSGWAEGDWDGNGDFDSGDLVAAFQSGGFEQGARVAVAAVPEPSSLTLIGLGVMTLPFVRRVRRGTANC